MTDITDFVASIGVNTHVDATTGPYGKSTLVVGSLGYTGISFIRDHAYGTDISAYTALANAGVGLDLILDDNSKAEIDSLISLAPAIRTFEGPNEVDYQPILTNGIADPVLAAIAEQQSVRAAISETAAVSSVPLIAESLADPDNLAPFAGNLAYADIANLHAYAVQGQPPRSVLADDLAIAQSLSQQPVALTETGYFTSPDDPDGVNESVQAKLTLDTLFDSASLGISLTVLYELFDEAPNPNDTDPELHYGLFNADGSPKLAATALHNLTTILAAANTATGTAPALSLSTTNLPDTGHTLVLTGNAGTTVVAIWAEPAFWDAAAHVELTVPVTTTTVDFGTLAASVIVSDPLIGTGAIASYTNVSSITVGLTDHPLIITISAPMPTPSPTPVATAPATVGTAASTTTLDQTIGVYRFFDKSNGTYFYTASASEALTVSQTRADLVAEGTGGIGLVAIAPSSNDPSASPVYRFFDTKFGTHFFTASASERDTTIATRTDLSYEPGSVFYEHSLAQAGDVPVYRFFDKVHGTHFYTDSATERAAIISTRSDLAAEGIGFYEPPANPA